MCAVTECYVIRRCWTLTEPKLSRVCDQHLTRKETVHFAPGLCRS